MAEFDIVIRDGRVVDPETGLDAVRHVGITGRSIAAVSGNELGGKTVVEADGLVVAAGFVDLHSHAQSLAGRRLRVCDGVTSALDLEAGRAPVSMAYDLDAAAGSPIHYGYSVSWALARAAALGAAELDGDPSAALRMLGETGWRGTATPGQVASMLAFIEGELADGAVGIGFLLGYAPEVDPAEYLAVSGLAASSGVPTFTHSRELVETHPATVVDGPEEVVRAAALTGVHAHYCHVNSTAGRQLERVFRLVERCRREGGRVTYEAYPYGYASTVIGAAFLSPEDLAAWGLEPNALTYLPTGERVRDTAQLEDLRRTDPAGLVLMDFLDEGDAADRAVLRSALTTGDAIVASDAMPLVPLVDGFSEETWPIGRDAVAHPRTAGCYSRALRLAREAGLPLADTLARCSLYPARVLEGCCPGMRKKARVQAGCDADLVLFDPAEVSDQADVVDTTRVSRGIRHVFVDGTAVVRDGLLDLEARPGRPIRTSL